MNYTKHIALGLGLIVPIATTYPNHASKEYNQRYEERCGYEFATEFSALFLKPMSSNVHYAAQAIPLPLPSPNWNIFDLHPGYHFGFDLGGRVLFNQRRTVLMADWERFKASTCQKVAVPSDDMVGPFFEIGPDASLYQEARGTVSFLFDQVNLDYGQAVSLGEYLAGTVFAGVGFARIKQTLCFDYSNTDETVVRTINTPITFIGAGPQLGADFGYSLYKGLSLSGSAYGTLLVGTAKNSTTYKALSPALSVLGVTPPNTQTTCVQHRSQLVPALQENIGVAYTHTFCENYVTTLEVGYQAQVYLNALQSVDMGSEVVTPPVTPDTVGVFARTFQRNISNFALAGAYITLDVVF